MMPKSSVQRRPAEMANSTTAAPRCPRPRRGVLGLVLTTTLTLPPSALVCDLGHPPGSLDSPVGLFLQPGGLVRGSNRPEAPIPCGARVSAYSLRRASCRSEWWDRFREVNGGPGAGPARGVRH